MPPSFTVDPDSNLLYKIFFKNKFNAMGDIAQ